MDSDYAYLGGEIINPNADYIVLSRNKAIIDTIELDKKHRFLHKIKGLTEGLYTINHGDELQLVLLEPEDSLLLRLNTLVFDESLVYSGKGNKKNNYFINEFLKNEKEEAYIIAWSQLDGITFQKRVDSLKKHKIKALENFVKKYNPSPLFLKIAKANIDYSYFTSKEVYPLMHFGKNKAAILNDLPENFYDYRQSIDYNDSFFSNHHSYGKFLRYNLSNLSLKSHDKHEKNACFDRKSLCYNLDRLTLIDSLILNPTIKDDLLYHFAMSFLSKSNNETHNNKLLKSYLNKSKSDQEKQKLARFANSMNLLSEGSRLPEIALTNYDAKELQLNTLINAPTVLSYWSHTYYNHFQDSHIKLKELKTKYPEVTFITINIDQSKLETSRKFIESHGYSNTAEFKFKSPHEAKETLAIYPLTKTMLVDQNKKIVNANTNIFSVQFEEQLLGLINR